MISARPSLPVTGIAAAALAAAVVLLLPQAAQPANVASSNSTLKAQPTYVYRVSNATGRADELFKDGFDVLESRQGKDLFVLGGASQQERLKGFGFDAKVEKAIAPPKWVPPQRRANNDHLSPSDAGETYYGGYHTVNAQYAHLDDVASQHSDLATTVTYGQSWLKSQGNGGYDLRAICITKKQAGDCQLSPNSTKPRFLLMSQIHAREITTGDVSWRWVDYLVNGYGTDSSVTSLLDSTELWVVPVANPDGVDIVQQGGDSPNLQRKNADDTNGGMCNGDAYSQLGVDLNRNTGSHWNSSGVSSDPCDQTFDGPNSDSEVENTALEGLFRNLWPASRTGTSPTSPAPIDTKGDMITMHSDASMVLFPWGYDSRVHTGNDTPLRAMARDMGQLTGYQYGQPGEILYNASGTTDDWTYDKLGVASFTIEVGDNTGGGCDGFLPSYSCQASFFWPKMQPALLYAAQHAAAPYHTS